MILALIAAIVLAAAAAVGFATARFVTRPLRRLEHAAAEVGAGNIEARAPENDGPAEVRSLAAVFNETVSKLGHLLRAQEEFVADASHELRTPLTALMLRLESLESAVATDGRADVEAALREVSRLSDMVEGLLALARADAVPSSTVDVAAVAAERVEMWQALANERGVSIVAQTDGVTNARAASQRVEQIVDNFVSNALDVAPAGSTVTVLARETADAVELRVRDQGPWHVAAGTGARLRPLLACRDERRRLGHRSCHRAKARRGRRRNGRARGRTGRRARCGRAPAPGLTPYRTFPLPPTFPRCALAPCWQRAS